MSLRRSFGWVLVGQASYFLLQFASSVALARLLTPYEMGVFAIAMAVVGLISVIQSLGLNNLLVREKILTPALVSTAFTVNAAIAVLLAGATATAGLAGAWLFKEAGVRNVLAVLALTPLIGALGFVPGALLEREGKFRSLSLLKTVNTAIGAAVTVSLAFAGESYMSLAYGQVLSAVTGTLSINLIGRRHVTWRLSLDRWREVASFGLAMLMISGVTRLSGRLGEVVLGQLLGLAALGLYSRASNLYSLLWDNVHIVVARVLFVDFSDLARRGESLRERYMQVVDIMTALLWPAFAGLAILSGPFIHAVYGNAWVGAAAPLSMLCLAAIVLVSITMTWEVFVVAGETGRQARFEFARTGAGLALFSLGCLFSLTAAAAGRIGEAVFSFVLYRPHLDRMTQTRQSDFAPIYLRSAGLTALAVGPAAALMLAYGGSPQTPLPFVLASVAAGVALWALGLKLLGHPLFHQALSILHRRETFAATSISR